MVSKFIRQVVNNLTKKRRYAYGLKLPILVVINKNTMNKFFFLFFTLTAFYSCSPTVSKPLYLESKNPKELIKLKYGEPTSIVKTKNDKGEIWLYEYNSQFKSDRKVVFDSNNKIVRNLKKHKKYTPRLGHYIAIGAMIIIGPFPALL